MESRYNQLKEKAKALKDKVKMLESQKNQLVKKIQRK